MNISLRSYFHACVALLAMALAARAQVVSVVPKLIEGERTYLLVETSRKDQRGEQSSRTPVILTVQSVSDEGAVLAWESGETEIENAPPEAIALLKSMNSATEGLRLECKFSPLGEFAGILNEAEVLQKMQLAVERLTETMMEQTPDPQLRERIRLGLSQAFQPAIMLALTTKNVGLYAGAAQIEVDVNEPVSVEAEVETALGNVESLLTVSAHDLDNDKNVVAIDVVSEPTPESVSALTVALLRRMLQTEDAEKIENAMKEFSLDLRDETNYQVDLSRGWPTQVDFLRVLNVEDSQRVDKTRITLQRIETP